MNRFITPTDLFIITHPMEMDPEKFDELFEENYDNITDISFAGLSISDKGDINCNYNVRLLKTETEHQSYCGETYSTNSMFVECRYYIIPMKSILPDKYLEK